jgi:hypothetical protein
MSVAPPKAVLAFFANLNFMNIKIPIVTDSAREYFSFIGTYEGWMKNFNVFNIFY